MDGVPIGCGQPDFPRLCHGGAGQVRYPDPLGSVELAFTLALDRLGRHHASLPARRPSKTWDACREAYWCDVAARDRR